MLYTMQNNASINRQFCDAIIELERGLLPFHNLSRLPDYFRLNRLIEQGADVNSYMENEDSPCIYRFYGLFFVCAPLHVAVFFNDMKLAKFLIEHNANVNITTRHGLATPLSLVASGGQLEMAKLLMSKGADIRLQDYYGKNPLIYAFEAGDIDMIILLLEHGAVVPLEQCPEFFDFLLKTIKNKDTTDQTKQHCEAIFCFLRQYFYNRTLLHVAMGYKVKREQVLTEYILVNNIAVMMIGREAATFKPSQPSIDQSQHWRRQISPVSQDSAAHRPSELIIQPGKSHLFYGGTFFATLTALCAAWYWWYTPAQEDRADLSDRESVQEE